METAMPSSKRKKTKMNTQETLVLKPHHFLDIMKLYGAGIAHFIPDLLYGHGFYREANKILRKQEVLIVLTIGEDDICVPCRFNKNGHCADSMPKNPVPAKAGILSKDEWNRTVDTRLFNALGINEGDEITAIALSVLAQEKLTPQVVAEIWQERPREETEKRIANLQKGLSKYLRQNKFYN